MGATSAPPPRRFAPAAAILFAICIARAAAQEVQVNTQWISDSPEADAAVSNTAALSSSIEQGMGMVYHAAGLPADLGASASVDGRVISSGSAPRPAPTTTARAPPPAPPPPPPPPSSESDAGGGSTILIASLAVGVVGLLGVVAWAVMAKGGNKNSKKESATERVIPARIRPPPNSYEPDPQPTAPPAPPVYYEPPAPPVYYPPPQQNPPVYYPPPQQNPTVYYPPPQTPAYYPPPQTPVYPPEPAPPRQKVFRVILRH